MVASTFEQNRRRLWGVAYRMLGSRADADDMVQEAWIRWQRAPQDEIRVPQAWLVTAITRLCIDRLRETKAERESYVGPWLPEPLVEESTPGPEAAAELASDLSIAFLAVLERLAPEERAAFLLHDVFDSGYGEIAQVLGKSEVACRQIVSRARGRVRDARPRVQVSAAARAKLLDGLVTAIRAHDKEGLVKLLARDATWTADGGGKTHAAKKVVEGGERIARFLLAVLEPYIEALDFRVVTVNGEPGLALVNGDRVVGIWAIQTDGRHILGGYAVLNPDKLKAVTTGAAPTSSPMQTQSKET